MNIHNMYTTHNSVLIYFLGAGTFPLELSLQQQQADTSGLTEDVSTALRSLRDNSDNTDSIAF